MEIEPMQLIVEECPCNLCSNFREYNGGGGADDKEDVDVALAVSCPDNDECDRAVEKVDDQVYK